MFKLEEAIEIWKKGLRKNEALEEGYVAELESHLRDEIEKSVKEGKSEEDSFASAVKTIGDADSLGEEYYKTDTRHVNKRPPWKESRFMPSLLLNYVKVARRNVFRQKVYSFINILGLSIGITACIFAGLYTKNELSYDKYHKNADQIYRVSLSHSESGNTEYSADSPALLGPSLKNVYPEIRNFSRIYFSKHNLVKAGNRNNYEDGVSYADSTFFDIFSFEAVLGNSSQFLKKPNSIIITESTAKRYFGNDNPLGKTIELNSKFTYEVAGVIKDVPKNSHFKFDFLAAYSALDKLEEAVYLPQWGATFGSYTYLLVANGFSAKDFENKTEPFFSTHTNLTNAKSWKIHVMPMPDIHLNSHLNEIEENGSMSRIYILGSISLFILLLACINFVNLSTARSSKRAVEIGIRKVLGAVKFQLIKQFIGESVLLSMVSLLISLITVLLAAPFFSTLVGSDINYDFINNWPALLLIIMGVLLVGVLAGIYPALFISSYQPITAIKGNNSTGSGRKGIPFLRKSLVVLQFSISIILIAGTIIINLQLKYLRNFNMGFDKEQMLVLPVHERIENNYVTIKNELKNIRGVLSVTACEGAPISENGTDTQCRPKGLGSSESFRIHVDAVDFDFMDHFGVKLVAGRNFSDEYQSDYTKAMIVNEKMVKNLGFTNPRDAIGKSYFISLNGYTPEIIGVVKDYNSSSLRNEMRSLVFMHRPKWFLEFAVKVNTFDISSTIRDIKDVWAKFFSKYPFEYHFLDESIDSLYKSEERYSNVISTFSVVAIFIACLGLFGLASFVTEQRKKEIGIRKVLGASVQSIIQYVSKEFVILVIISNIIAWPVSYYFMNRWLQEFAYQIDLNVWMFLVSGLITLLIALTTVGYQAIKAALANPVKSLKYE